MNVFSFISNIFEPAVKLIDEIHTSDEEKLKLQAQIKAVENELLAKVIDYESKLLEGKTAIITAEATGQSWIQRNWRPITMLTFLARTHLACGLVSLVAPSCNNGRVRLPHGAFTHRCGHAFGHGHDTK